MNETTTNGSDTIVMTRAELQRTLEDMAAYARKDGVRQGMDLAMRAVADLAVKVKPEHISIVSDAVCAIVRARESVK